MYRMGSCVSSSRTWYLPSSLRSTNTSGVTLGAVVSVKSAPGLGLSLRSSCQTSWIFSIDMPVFFEICGRRLFSRSSRWFSISDPQLVVVRHAGNELQQQALFQRAGADAGRIEPLHDAQRLFGNRPFVSRDTRASRR